jgi:hypothetical protein
MSVSHAKLPRLIEKNEAQGAVAKKPSKKDFFKKLKVITTKK